MTALLTLARRIGFQIAASSAWDGRAACRNAITQDPWFPTREDAQRMGAELKYALAHCASCPVQRECLKAGMDSASDGIWGGVFDWEFAHLAATDENLDRFQARAGLRYQAWGLTGALRKESVA